MTGAGGQVETDPRFPSGRWVGYFLQKYPPPGRHSMELLLTFRDGLLSGEGRDWVGDFTLRGHYQLADGRCDWAKQYIGKHAVHYRGFNEGKGIWGVWEIAGFGLRGGFHIWPEGTGEPTGPALAESVDLPITAPERDDAPVPVGGTSTPTEPIS